MTDNKISQNGLLDILLNGLKQNGLNKNALGQLSKVSKLFRNRLHQDFIWQQLPTKEPITGTVSGRDQYNINDFVEAIPVEYPCAQPTNSQEWANVDAVPREIKRSLIALHAKVGSDLLTYVRELYIPYAHRDSSNAEEVLDWLQALQALYDSAKKSPDLFHGLFLENHNFARRAHALAKKSTLNFSTAVLKVCAECRFSSLTMNSKQLDDFFNSLAGLYAKKQAEHYPVPFQVTDEIIKEHIHNTFYPKTLLKLWPSVKATLHTPESQADDSLSVGSHNEIKATPSP